MSEEARWRILCFACARASIEDDGEVSVSLAMFGPQGADDEDYSVLACVPWDQRVPWVKSEPFFCDDCGQKVSVAASSGWFVDRHREEEAS